MLFWLTLGHFWCSVVTSVTLSSPLRIKKKKLNPKYPNIQKRPKNVRKSPFFLTENPLKKNPKKLKMSKKFKKSENLKKMSKKNHVFFKYENFKMLFFCPKKIKFS